LKEGKSFDEELTQFAEKEITPALIAAQDAEEEREESGDGQSGSRRDAGSERRPSARQ
jgi:hypothetical protein